MPHNRLGFAAVATIAFLSGTGLAFAPSAGVGANSTAAPADVGGGGMTGSGSPGTVNPGAHNPATLSTPGTRGSSSGTAAACC